MSEKLKGSLQRTVILVLLALIVLAGAVFILIKEEDLMLERPPKVELQSVISEKEETAEIKWKAVECSGYLIDVATDPEFKNVTIHQKAKKSKKTATIKWLKQGKKYYFRIRAVNRGAKEAKLGKWSNVIIRTAHQHKYILKKATRKKRKLRCDCGKKFTEKLRSVYRKPKIRRIKPAFSPTSNTFGESPVVATGVNSRQKEYRYVLYCQTSPSLNRENEYMKQHGCSTCALTTILRATVEDFPDYDPNQVLHNVIRKVAGSEVYNNNFRKSMKMQMPISLKGIAQVLTEYGVKHKYVYSYTQESATREITAHLKEGDPVIFMISPGLYASNPHTMLMLGLDEEGKVIVGDSMMQKKRWGDSAYGLVKYSQEGNPQSNTVANIVSYMDGSTGSVANKGFFYSGGKVGNRG